MIQYPSYINPHLIEWHKIQMEEAERSGDIIKKVLSTKVLRMLGMLLIDERLKFITKKEQQVFDLADAIQENLQSNLWSLLKEEL